MLIKKRHNRIIFLPVIFLLLGLLTSCSSSDSSANSVTNAINDVFNSSPNVDLVKNGNVQACSTATLGQMADAFMSNPSWREFTSVSGGTVVELTGEISYQGMPATAKIQFEVTGGTFKAVYLGINDVDQNLFTLSGLLDKMCAAA